MPVFLALLVQLPAAVLDAEHSTPLEPTVVVLTKPGTDNPTGAVHVSYKTEVAPNIPEYSFKQEAEDLRKHRLVRIGEEEKNIDMDVVQPYRKIVQHAGINMKVNANTRKFTLS